MYVLLHSRHSKVKGLIVLCCRQGGVKSLGIGGGVVPYKKVGGGRVMLISPWGIQSWIDLSPYRWNINNPHLNVWSRCLCTIGWKVRELKSLAGKVDGNRRKCDIKMPINIWEPSLEVTLGSRMGYGEETPQFCTPNRLNYSLVKHLVIVYDIYFQYKPHDLG